MIVVLYSWLIFLCGEIMSDEWRTKLKAGDKVYVRRGMMDDDLRRTTVKRITPKGHVRTEDDNLFRDGYRRIDAWNREFLVQWTQELEDNLKAEAHFNQLAYSINAIDARTLTPEQVQKIYDIIKKEE